MSNLPVPQIGQPIDSSYIYQIVNAINEISTKMSAAYSQSYFNNGSTSGTYRTNDMMMAAGYTTVTSTTNATVSANDEKPFTYSFGITFPYPPVVTVSPVAVIDQNASRDVSVVITKITTANVSGYVVFNTKGTANVALNVIAIGPSK